MPFLVRKINKRDQLPSLNDYECIGDIYADVPTNEFRTTKGTLSTWKINKFEELAEAVLAIAVSSSKISKMDFIVIDTDLLDRNNLEYEQTYAGMDIPIPDLQNTHYDIINVSIKKIADCANVYKTILLNENVENEKYIIRFTESEIKGILKNAILQQRVDKDKASKPIREVIEKLIVA